MNTDSNAQNYIVKTAVKRYMLPTMLSTLSIPAAQFMDAVILGNYVGNIGLGAASMVLPIFILYETLNGLVGVGGSIRYTIMKSRGENQGANGVFTMCIVTALLFGLLFSSLSGISAPLIANLMGATGELKEYASEYGRVLLLGMPIVVLSQVMGEFIRSDNEPRTVMVGVFLTNFINVALDILFIGYFKMGVQGAAYALLCGASVTLFYYIITSKKRDARFTGNGLQLSQLCLAFKIGSPSALALLGAAIVSIIAAMSVLRVGGADGVAMNTAVNNIFCLGQYLFFGSIFAIRPLVSTFYGEGDFKRQEQSAKLMLLINLLISVCSCLFILIFATQITQIFGITDVRLASSVIHSLRIAGLCLLFDSLVMFFIYYYQAIESTNFSLSIGLCRNYIIMNVFMVTFADIFGTNGVWYGRLAGEIVSCLYILVAVFILKRKERSLFLFIPFHKQKTNELYVSMSNHDDLYTTFDKVTSFCKSNGVEDRKINLIQVLIEEIYVNICKHGINDKKVHYIDILIRVEETQTTVRVRDDGLPFNPLSIEVEKDIEDDKNLGIRVLKSISKTQKYDRILSFNNLVVTV